MVGHRKQRRGWHPRYLGPRVNCESVPCLPVGAVAWVLDDPRRVPFLMLWQDRFSETIIEAVRVSVYSDLDPPDRDIDWTGWVEVKRTNGTRSLIQTVKRALPRNGGTARFVICPCCQRLRRALYAWEVNRWRTNSARDVNSLMPIGTKTRPGRYVNDDHIAGAAEYQTSCGVGI